MRKTFQNIGGPQSFTEKCSLRTTLEEFHELLAESGYTCACALKPCAP